MQDTVGADGRAVADHDVRMHDGARANARARADRRQTAPTDAVASTAASGATEASGVHTRPPGGRSRRQQPARRARTSGTATSLRMTAHGALRDVAGRSRRSPWSWRASRVFGVGEKSQVAGTGRPRSWPRVVSRCRIAFDRAIQATSQLAERHESENITRSARHICSTKRASWGRCSRSATS